MNIMLEKLMHQRIINKPYLITSLVIFIFTRLIGDLVLSLFDKYNVENLYIWNSLTALLITDSIFYVLFYDITYKKFSKTIDLTQLYFNEMTRLIYIAVGIGVISAFIPNPKHLMMYDLKLFNILLIDIVSILLIYAGGLALLFFYKWSVLRKMKQTKAYLAIIFTSFFILVLFHIVNSFYDLPRFDYFFVVAIAVFSFLTTSRNSWIAELPKSRKYLLLMLSALLSSFSFIIFAFVISGDSTIMNTLKFFMGGDLFPSV